MFRCLDHCSHDDDIVLDMLAGLISFYDSLTGIVCLDPFEDMDDEHGLGLLYV